jgi:Polyketide cyclase / dehydrase and lipid transport
MASIRREVSINAPPEHVWSAVRDVGALHTRLVPGFVIDTKLEDGARMVTFGNGSVARELIVDVDDGARRLAWAVVGTRMTHHNASLRGERSNPWSVDRRPVASRNRPANCRDDRAGTIGHEAYDGRVDWVGRFAISRPPRIC